jgi:hypothetical protein
MIAVLEACAPFTDLLPVKHDYLMKSRTLKGGFVTADILKAVVYPLDHA